MNGATRGSNPASERARSHRSHNRRARAYEITAAGRRRLGIEEARWRSVTDAVNYVLKHA
ncbi:MAG: hypothetical protein DMF95_18285 [Acidobacteria bacterium]|nr:MAG: hypothetical protein DMF96_00925 [Acidobacteriota bacterium]PYR23000.1 MAG: hypothetical protein DMF94_02720 [Acidobacteriota bacterium]PYR46525.1 MAG: hypothetical protein DMF95_18285 [Acidobacteriota bacterium]